MVLILIVHREQPIDNAESQMQMMGVNAGNPHSQPGGWMDRYNIIDAVLP